MIRVVADMGRIMAVAVAAAVFVHAALAMDEIPGVQNFPPVQTVDPNAANQGAFPYYYGSGLPSEDDLVDVGQPPSSLPSSSSSTSTRLPSALVDIAPLPEIPSGDAIPAPHNEEALRLQVKAAQQMEISRIRAAFSLLKSYSESGETDKALEIFATMPPFGDNALTNEFRADAANLLIIDFCRDKQLARAREIYDSLPKEIPGAEAMLAKGRIIINLTTFYVMNDAYNDAYAVLMDIAWIQNRASLDAELFKLMTRMIPYLDNAGETDKAKAVYEFLLKQVDSPEKSRLFADNFPSLPRYFLEYGKRSDARDRRDARLDFMHHIFTSLDALARYPEIAMLQMSLAGELVDFYTELREPDRARQYYEFMQNIDKPGAPPQ